MVTRSHIIDFLIEIKLRLDRGNALFYWFRNIILIVAGVKYLIELGVFETVIVGFIVVVLIYFVGWLDLSKLKIMQREQELATGKYNNYFRKLSKKFK